MNQQERIYQLLWEEDEVSWRSILYDLVRTEQMNPWDVDVSLLTRKYIETIKKMKEMDFRVSGRVLLAAAILLKFKSSWLLGHDLNELDRLLASTEEGDEFFSEFDPNLFRAEEVKEEEKPRLIPRLPQPRKRKVSIYDLAEALQKAMEVKMRKVKREFPKGDIEVPKKKKDIAEIIREVYNKVKSFVLRYNKPVKFSQLVPPPAGKEDKVFTFIPLLHLDFQRKVDLKQRIHFGEIWVRLLKR